MTDLYPVQWEAIKQAAGRERFGFFMEMGLGKTLVTLSEFEQIYAQRKADVLMIICPNSLVAVWRQEIRKHGFPFEFLVKPDRLSQIKPGTVVVYNYESLIATAGDLIPGIVKNFRVYCAFDESVQIKNFKAARWKAIEKWQKFLTYVRLLSGRPMVQSPMDLWPQLTILGAKISNSPYAFRNRYCRMGGWMNKVVVGVMNEEDLTNHINSVAWKATKKQWTDLPDKLYTVRHYTMTDEQEQMYKIMFRDMLVQLSNDKTISVNQAVHKYSKLQQIGSGFMFDENRDGIPLMDFAKVPKLRMLEEFLEETESKVIVFAHYKPSVEALINHFSCPFIKGGMTEQEITANMKKFNESSCQVIVAQSTAAKYGLTLLGNEDMPCHTTFYFENNYSLDARIQSEDRNHRHGQSNSVLYVDAVGNSVDAKIIRSLQAKDDLSRTILGIKEIPKNGY